MPEIQVTQTRNHGGGKLNQGQLNWHSLRPGAKARVKTSVAGGPRWSMKSSTGSQSKYPGEGFFFSREPSRIECPMLTGLVQLAVIDCGAPRSRPQ